MSIFNAATGLVTIFVLLLTGLGSRAAAAPLEILVIGDSLTAGFGLPAQDGFTVKLQAALAARHVDANVIDGGVSGETSAGGLATLDWQLADKPDYALLELGANDMLRGLPPKDTKQNLAQILTRLKGSHVPTLICGMRAASNWGPDYTRSFDAIYPELARQFDEPLYPFFLEGVALDPKLVQPDGLHPNEAGVDVIVQRILPSVLALIKLPH